MIVLVHRMPKPASDRWFSSFLPCSFRVLSLKLLVPIVGAIAYRIRGVYGLLVRKFREMADADWGYVGEGNHKVSIYRKKTPVLRHVPENEAIDRLLELIDKEGRAE